MKISRKKYMIFLLTIVCIITIGFALLSSILNIEGNTIINANTWNIHFDNIVVDSDNNVTGTQSIIDNTAISFAVDMANPGDSYKFYVDVLNTGTFDAMISTLSKSDLTTAQAKYLEYTITYSDGVEIQEKDKLVKTNGSETLCINLKFKNDVATEDLPTETDTITLSFALTYIQADSTAQDVGHDYLTPFIAKAKAGNATSSDVGKEFKINLGTFGEHTLRVANVSTPSECSGADFSQTACGVVMEFADIIATHKMNSTDTNVGGWPATSMRTFVNTDIYNALPSNVKSAIIDTSVVSSHGSTTDETNFTSTDKLYLLSTHEVYIDVASYPLDYYDTSYDNTRQLDYYAAQNVTTTSYTGAIKKKGSSATDWWLRSASANTDTYAFFIISSIGECWFNVAYGTRGVSPAFRIA